MRAACIPSSWQLTDCFLSRYNFKWTRAVQDAVLTALLDGWLGGSLVPEGRLGRLLTLEEVGELFKGVACLYFHIVHHQPGN